MTILVPAKLTFMGNIALLFIVGASSWCHQTRELSAPRSVNALESKIRPALATEPVQTDADDPAIWWNKKSPENSRIIGTDKSEKPNGGLFVFDMNGRVVQRIADVDKPNNVDVEYGFNLDGVPTDIVVASERKTSSLRVFKISSEGVLSDVGGLTKVFETESGERAEPMGVGIYKRPRDGKCFVVVARKSGSNGQYLWQYELVANGKKIDLKKVREFGQFSGNGEIEAVCVDDLENRVYYADEQFGIRIGVADPDAADAAVDLGAIATEKFGGDREGISIFSQGPGKGYVLVTEQIKGSSRLHVYPRQVKANAKPIVILSTGADDTDGLESSTENFGGQFPRGFVVAMNSSGKNFFIYEAREFLRSVASAK